uniref:Uncharacterized protein n=1 Tax=Cacopsylla melanoneura TaxID=428564 RepID=A0A8D9ARS9_9HEMI
MFYFMYFNKTNTKQTFLLISPSSKGLKVWNLKLNLFEAACMIKKKKTKFSANVIAIKFMYKQCRKQIVTILRKYPKKFLKICQYALIGKASVVCQILNTHIYKHEQKY